MNQLNHLSWTSYLEIVILLLVIYYVFAGIRFYTAYIQRLLGCAVKSDAYQGLPDQLVYQETASSANSTNVPENYIDDNYPDDDIREADSLTASVKSCIAAASGDAYAPDKLTSQIKNIFKKHTSLKASPHRPAINELVVAECERTGTALLTEDEVDQWWSD